MHDMYELKESLCKELDEYSRKPLTLQTLETIHTLTDVIKNIAKIDMLDQASEYSNDGYSGVYSKDIYTNDDYSRRRGRYSRGISNRGYSRGDAKDHMVEEIERMMDKASTERERKALRDCMSAIQEG